MVSYATPDQITEAYGEDALRGVSAPDGDTASDTLAIERALQSSTAEINAWLEARYTLPLNDPPELLRHLCIDMALYKVSADFGIMTEEKRVRYEDAVALLKNISACRAGLGITQAPDDPAPQTVSLDGPPRLFTRQNMEGL